MDRQLSSTPVPSDSENDDANQSLEYQTMARAIKQGRNNNNPADGGSSPTVRIPLPLSVDAAGSSTKENECKTGAEQATAEENTTGEVVCCRCAQIDAVAKLRKIKQTLINIRRILVPEQVDADASMNSSESIPAVEVCENVPLPNEQEKENCPNNAYEQDSDDMQEPPCKKRKLF